jgi:hypothetical protein
MPEAASAASVLKLLFFNDGRTAGGSFNASSDDMGTAVNYKSQPLIHIDPSSKKRGYLIVQTLSLLVCVYVKKKNLLVG